MGKAAGKARLRLESHVDSNGSRSSSGARSVLQFTCGSISLGPALEFGTSCPLTHKVPGPRDSVPHSPGLFLRVWVLMAQKSILQSPCHRQVSTLPTGTSLLEHLPFPRTTVQRASALVATPVFIWTQVLRADLFVLGVNQKHPNCPPVGGWTNRSGHVHILGNALQQ